MEVKPVKVKVFSDMIESIGKIWNTIKSIAKIPKKERVRYRQQFRNTLDTMNDAISLINARLRELLSMINKGWINGLDYELTLLGDQEDWRDIERRVRLCRNLRDARSDMNYLIDKFKARISIKDTKELKENFDKILTGEDELADYIVISLRDLSSLSTLDIENELEHIKNEIENFKDGLDAERYKIMDLEKEIIGII
ncbi:MAG: hypothetical protein ACFE9S_16500 [Candidatus Hermodarchaeota archaeon]